MTTLSPVLQAVAETLAEKVLQPTTIKGKSEDVCRRAGLDPNVIEATAQRILDQKPDTDLLPTGAIITLGVIVALVALEDTQ